MTEAMINVNSETKEVNEILNAYNKGKGSFELNGLTILMSLTAIFMVMNMWMPDKINVYDGIKVFNENLMMILGIVLSITVAFIVFKTNKQELILNYVKETINDNKRLKDPMEMLFASPNSFLEFTFYVIMFISGFYLFAIAGFAYHAIISYQYYKEYDKVKDVAVKMIVAKDAAMNKTSSNPVSVT